MSLSSSQNSSGQGDVSDLVREARPITASEVGRIEEEAYKGGGPCGHRRAPVWIGSVAEYMLTHVSVPVLIVRPTQPTRV